MMPGDGWWTQFNAEAKASMRSWVKWRLLHDPFMSEHDVDRFIASLPRAKQEELAERARAGRDARGF